MNNPRLAARYAKSLVDLATEQNKLDAVKEDMFFIQSICKSNPDFVAVLRSPVINGGTKKKIVDSIVKGKIADLSEAFIQLLISKSREDNLPEIATAFIEQFKEIKNIHTVKITTAVAMSDSLKETILAKVKQSTPGKNFEMETAVDDSLIGGFVLETDGRALDASILKELKDVKKQFTNNDYLHKLR